jgi:hypothetical protein
MHVSVPGMSRHCIASLALIACACGSQPAGDDSDSKPTSDLLAACSCDTSKDTVCSRNICQPDGSCAIKPVPDGVPCVDDDPCTAGDVCAKGSCSAGLHSMCACRKDDECLDDGDLCNGFAFCDKAVLPWTCRLNPATVVTCPADDGPCQLAGCDKKTGKCGFTNRPDDTACDDKNVCTTDDACTAGVCGGLDVCSCKTSADCKTLEDANPCNGTLYCDNKSQKCVVNPATVVQCDTTGDTICKKNSCQPQTGVCLPKAAPATAGCDDGDKCTAGDHCNGGECAPGKSVCVCKTDGDCQKHDDGDKCNGLKFCDKATGSCKDNPASIVTCPSVADTACAHNVCLPNEGTCTMAARADVTLHCELQKDAFDKPVQVCKWQTKTAKDSGKPADKGPFGCDDGDVCTSGETCDGKVCKASAVTCKCQSNADCVAKDDGNLCNGTMYCDKSLKVADCVFNPASKVFCSKSDDTDCLKARCDTKTGTCGLQPQASGKGCDDAKPCTVSTVCSPTGGCSGGKTNPCDDKNLCTVDACAKGAGCSHVTKACNDGNSCTEDGCDAKTGQCKLAPKKDGTVCNGDDNGCTVNDQCQKTVCKVGKKLTCTNKTAACEQPACISKGPSDFHCGVVARNDGSACDAPGSCLVGAVCKAGKCGKGTTPSLSHKTFGAKSAKTVFSDIAARKDGMLLVAGSVVAKPAPKAHAKAMLWLFDSVGQQAWEHEVKGNGGHAEAQASAVEAIGDDALVIASVRGDDGTLDGQVERLGATGKTLWSTRIKRPKLDLFVQSVAVDGNGSVVIGAGEKTATDWRGLLLRLSPAGGLLGDPIIHVPKKDMKLERLERPAIALMSGGQIAVLTNSLTIKKDATTVKDAAGKVVKADYFFYGHGTQIYSATGKLLHDSHAEQQLLNRVGGSNLRHVDKALRVLPSGEIHVVSTFPWALNSDRMATVSRSSKAEFGWRTQGPFGGYPQAVAEAGGSRAAVVGSLRPKGASKSKQWLASVDALGNVQWSKEFDAPHSGRLLGVDVLADGRIAAVGSVDGDSSGQTSRGTLTFANPFGATSCQQLGACGGKKWGGCDDGKACTADNCMAKLGCVHTSGKDMRCGVGNQCSEEALCEGASCKPSANGRLFIRQNNRAFSSYPAFPPETTHGLRATKSGFEWFLMALAPISGKYYRTTAVLKTDQLFKSGALQNMGVVSQVTGVSATMVDATHHAADRWWSAWAFKKDGVRITRLFLHEKEKLITALYYPNCVGCWTRPVCINSTADGGLWMLMQTDGSRRTGAVQRLSLTNKTNVYTFTDYGYVPGCGDGVCASGETKSTCFRDCGVTPSAALSCAGRCGLYDKSAKCQCEPNCLKFNDCCADHQGICQGAAEIGVQATDAAAMPDLSLVVSSINVMKGSVQGRLHRIGVTAKVIWGTVLKSSGVTRPYSVTADKAGRIFTVGRVDVNAAAHSHFCARLHSDGKIKWLKTPAATDMGHSDAVLSLDDGAVLHSGWRIVDAVKLPAMWKRAGDGALVFARTYAPPASFGTEKIMLPRPDELIALADGYALGSASHRLTGIFKGEKKTVVIRTDRSGYASCIDAGTCASGKPSCDDNKPCTADLCHPKLGCQHLPITGNDCGSGKSCDAGQCK